MDYHYEQLDDGRFQQLCQSLIAKEFPKTQCFPLHQPDGGRDAVAFTDSDRGDREFYVFQVKFTRNPQSETDPHKKLLEVIESESPKVRQLITRGAKGYFLLTNISGTSHLDAGAIDKANKLLTEGLGIPAVCWWRDDLNRRLDNAYDLKWAYPDIMTGTDLLRLIVETALTEDRERRTLAVRAFVRSQYEDDREVKFKQIELQNRLFDLFVDVPVEPRTGREDSRRSLAFRYLKGAHGVEGDKEIGAAEFFLSHRTVRHFPVIVLEGAPGQGKSTLAQYLCQVHRLRVLERFGELKEIPERHRTSAARLPIRVDLRDLATWLSRKDPFSAEDDARPPSTWAKSVESFLSHLIHHLSGGSTFSVSDLQAVAKLSSLLIVFDGLDEVADLAQRRAVVAELISGISRLRELASSLQVVITSRPSVFTSSALFPEKTFPHFQLAALSKDLIFAYGERWAAARKLQPKDAAAVRRILKQKMELPHIRDLARNPMQLAIVLSLIRKRGASLPDKRTNLYDLYVELFFDREAEKSDVVRENRDLLVDLHRYLAWLLHAEAERRGTRGSVSTDRLQRILREYLTAEQRDHTAVSNLFSGVVERIVFLVSRVEGTFEFEVQPLREYFAARHLYETAPYSPAGSEQKGTKPDRFDAIAPSPNWLNVTRFFSGCFSKGELPGLVDRLQVLVEADGFKYTNYPRRLAAMLLGDWVFSQDQRSTAKAIQIVITGIGLNRPFGHRRRRFSFGSDVSLQLPEGCGREELAHQAFGELRKKLRPDLMYETAQLIVGNASPAEADSRWMKEIDAAPAADRTYWLRIGLALGSLPRASPDTVRRLVEGGTTNPDQLSTVFSAGHVSHVLNSVERSRALLDSILAGKVFFGGRRTDPMSRCMAYVQPAPYATSFHRPSAEPLREVLKHGYFGSPAIDGATDAVGSVTYQTNPVIHEVLQFNVVAERERGRSSLEWGTSIEPWSSLVEEIRRLWGDRWVAVVLAHAAANVGRASSEETTHATTQLHDGTVPLCLRIRHARRKVNAPHWWKDQIDHAQVPAQALLTAMAAATWAGTATLIRVADDFGTLLDSLTGPEWTSVVVGSRHSVNLSRQRSGARLRSRSLPAKMSSRLAVLLAQQGTPDDRRIVYQKYLAKSALKDDTTVAFAARAAVELAVATPSGWNKALALLEQSYCGRSPIETGDLEMRLESKSIPLDIARHIMQAPAKYPRSVVYLAEERCQAEIEQGLRPVAEIAEIGRWFERSET